MAESVTEIINLALGGLGQTPINDSSESVFSRLAAIFYPAALAETLRAHPWNFAVRRVALSPAESEDPVVGYTFRFILPPDCLRIIDGGPADYKVEGRAIVCDQSAIALRYIARVEDPTQHDALFDAALVANLMWRLTYPVTKSTTLRDSNFAAYTQLLQQARSVDAQEEPPDEFEDSSILRARRG